MRAQRLTWLTLSALLMTAPLAYAEEEGDSDEESGEESTNPKDAVREAAEGAAEDAAAAAVNPKDAVLDAAAEAAAADAAAVEAAAAEAAATEAAAAAAEAAAADAAAVEAAAAEAEAAEEAKKAEVTLRAEAGFLGLFGNVESLSVNGLVHFGIQGGRHGFKLNVGGVGGQTKTVLVDEDGDPTGESKWIESARRFFGDARYDLTLVPDVNSIYVGGGAFHDQYAGYVLRARGDAGYAHQLFSDDRHKLAAEAGFNFTHERYVDDGDPLTATIANFIGARLFADYSLNLNDAFGFTLTEEFLIGGTDNVDSDDPAQPDGRSITTVGLTGNISKVFSIKAGYQLAVDIVPPPGFKPIDHTVTFNLVANIL